MSSPRFLHGNAHAEKVVHIIKQIYNKANDIKLALLLLKTTPISNKVVTMPLPMCFFGRQLKAHLPVFRHHNDQLANTCTDNDESADSVVVPNIWQRSNCLGQA